MRKAWLLAPVVLLAGVSNGWANPITSADFAPVLKTCEKIRDVDRTKSNRVCINAVAAFLQSEVAAGTTQPELDAGIADLIVALVPLVRTEAECELFANEIPEAILTAETFSRDPEQTRRIDVLVETLRDCIPLVTAALGTPPREGAGVASQSEING